MIVLQVTRNKHFNMYANNSFSISELPSIYVLIRRHSFDKRPIRNSLREMLKEAHRAEAQYAQNSRS